MPSPFPGMDPYLEGRRLWPDVHHALITTIRDALAPQVAPAYFVAIEERAYIVEAERGESVSLPDAAVIAAADGGKASGGVATATALAHAVQTVTLPRYERVQEGYLEVRDGRTHEVITAIELLSPTNKALGEGRREYEAKRRHVLQTLTNLVEIDLLRGGAPMRMDPTPGSPYRILLASGWEYPTARVYAFGISQAIPEVAVPLREGESPATLALGTLLAQIYDRARYDLRLDYRVPPPEPPLSSEEAAWMEELLRAAGLRGEARLNSVASGKPEPAG
jgi:Protein of unknown function (DUF4058)